MDIKTLTIVGTGFLGTQISHRAIMYDYKLKLFDTDKGALEKIEKSLTGLLKRKNLLEKMDLLSYHTELAEALSDTDFIIEAIPENL